MKKILVINGSPRKGGNTESLADELIRGTMESGHKAKKINLRELTIKNCKGCFLCQVYKGDPCVQKDDMSEVYSALREADVVVWASPLYWMHFTSLMKAAIDRLFALAAYEVPQKETALVIASTMNDADIFSMIVPYYETCLVKNLNWENRGMLLAGGVNDVGDVLKTDYLQKAFELGKSL